MLAFAEEWCLPHRFFPKIIQTIGKLKAVSKFATLGLDKPKIEVNICHVLMENVEAFSPEMFVSDTKFIQEITDMKLEPTDNYPIGIVLISRVTVCLVCNSTMCTRANKPS